MWARMARGQRHNQFGHVQQVGGAAGAPQCAVVAGRWGVGTGNVGHREQQWVWGHHGRGGSTGHKWRVGHKHGQLFTASAAAVEQCMRDFTS